MDERPESQKGQRSRAGELVSPAREAKLVPMSPLGRLQYWMFRKGESVGRSHWTRDIRFVVVASITTLLLLAAAGLLAGGAAIFSTPEAGKSEGTPNLPQPLPPAGTR